MQAPPSWGFLREVSLAGTRVLASSLWRTALAHYTWTLVSVSLHPPTHSAKPMPSTTQLLVIDPQNEDRKSTRLNSSHSQISYAVFCLKKKKKQTKQTTAKEMTIIA